jgi:AraC family transcriptional regulator of adaptative response / DNA-3-methyladenine glycosylase II
MLAALAARAAPGTEWIEDGVWHRRIDLDGNTGTVAVAHLPERNSVAVTIRFPEVRRSPSSSRRCAACSISAPTSPPSAATSPAIRNWRR